MNFEQIKKDIPARLMQIAERICAAGGRCYLVGGFVRDAILGRSSRDFDVEVYDIEQETLLKILRDFGKPNLVGKAFGVVHLMTRGLELDLSFQEAARRRDFTVNAMGLSLPNLELSDPYSGKEDLEKKILRHVSDAFAEDSLRVLRGVQFASRFSLTLAPETAALCRGLSLADLSSERIFEEFKKWLLKPGRPSLGLKAFREMNLERFFPEIRGLGSENSDEKLGELLDRISEKLPRLSDLMQQEILAFTALLSGAENGQAVTAFLSRITNEVQLLKKSPILFAFIPQMISSAENPEENFNAEFLRRASVKLGGLNLAHLYLQSSPLLSDVKSQEASQIFEERARALGVFENAPEPLLRGSDLIQMGLKPGRLFGEIIKEEFELQLQGKIQTAEEAKEFAVKKIGTKN